VPTSDFYTVTFSPTLAATAATALGSLVSPSTKRAWITGVRVKIGNTGAVAGNNILFQLARPNASNTGTTTVTPAAHDFSAAAALATGYSAWSTAPTVGVVLASWELPQTSGSMWEEFPPTGDEWGVPAIATGAANSGVHLFATASVSTSTPLIVDFIFSE
jgi:hypothetical protein